MSQSKQVSLVAAFGNSAHSVVQGNMQTVMDLGIDPKNFALTVMEAVRLFQTGEQNG